MGTIKADTVTGLADPNKVTLPNNPSVGSTTATLNFGNTVIANASAGSSTITGEGGSTTTNLQQGLCKAWCRFDDGASSDSFNVSSVTDHGTGDYQVFIANDMANATYIATLMFGETGGSGVLRIGNRDLAAASVGCVGTDGDQSTGQDINRCGVDVAGDLA